MYGTRLMDLCVKLYKRIAFKFALFDWKNMIYGFTKNEQPADLQFAA